MHGALHGVGKKASLSTNIVPAMTTVVKVDVCKYGLHSLHLRKEGGKKKKKKKEEKKDIEKRKKGRKGKKRKYKKGKIEMKATNKANYSTRSQQQLRVNKRK